MSKEEIIKNNKLIAEFMEGVYTSKLFVIDRGYIWLPNHNMTKIENIKYHKSWDWLTPVVEKIESLETEQDGNFQVHISSNSCSIQGTNLWKSVQNLSKYGPVYMSDPNAIFETKLESTYYNVVEFIKWWNNNKINDRN